MNAFSRSAGGRSEHRPKGRNRRDDDCEEERRRHHHKKHHRKHPHCG